MVIDSISNLIISLKNAQERGLSSTRAPFSKLSASILEVLKKEGFISDFENKGKEVKKTIDITLKYDNSGNPAISNVKRVSTQSKRIYKSVDRIYPVKNGYGRLILSTPAGIVTDVQARKQKVGGEALFEIW
jgi:small subunit ribosomal protein S8